MAVGTAFILVPGLHTGGWIWQDVAERLRAAGAEAYPLTLSGMGGPDAREASAAGEVDAAGTDLETHIADVLRAVERTDAREVVLVGHCYGVHPVVGAADRLPDRIARIVLVDTPMPQDGDPPAALVPEQALREECLRRIAAAGDGEAGPGAEEGEGPAGPGAEEGKGSAGPGAEEGKGSADPAAVQPPPSEEEWRERGSFQGLDATAAALLARLAVPQPWATLARPLRLNGVAGAVPVTGVLCAANGSSLAMIEAVLALGDPRSAYLAAPHLSYLEMATGHWPMLSEPDATAQVLLRAAAGEGAAVRPPSGTGEPLPGAGRSPAGAEGPPAEAERPAHLRPFLIDPPERARERVGRVDLHLPDGEGPLPAVVFVHGGPVPEGGRPTPRDWPAFVGYARLVAGLGAAGVLVDHRLHGVADFGRAAQDVADAIDVTRAHPRVDAERVALWFFSTGGLLAADWLAAPPPWLRCVALTYPLLTPLPGWGVPRASFRPVAAVRAAGRLPVVLTRVGRERAEFAATVEEFRVAALSAEVDVEVVDVPSAGHGFETTDHSDEARQAVDRAARAVLSHLRPPPAG